MIRALALTLSLSLAQPAERPLDAVVAVADTESDPTPTFVLRSDFVLHLRYELLARGAPDALHVAVDPVYVAAPFLDQLVAEAVVAREAERAALADLDPAELTAERAWALTRIGGERGLETLLAATGCSHAEFDVLVRRRAVATRYLLDRHARLIEPTSRELRERWERLRADEPATTPETFSSARADLSRRMVREALPRALRQYLRGLGGRVRVRLPLAVRAP